MEKKVVLNPNKTNMINYMYQWINANPHCFGEDILIIQKSVGLSMEGNHHIIDFWALDKSGTMIVIECHIDRLKDVDQWVMLKPKIGMPKFTKNQLIEIYQKYLNTFKEEENAIENMEEFFGISIVELTIKDTRRFRLLLVSPKFSLDTMSKVTWLGSLGREIKCFIANFTKGEKGAKMSIKQYFPAKQTDRYDLGFKSFTDYESKTIKTQNQRYLFWIGLLNKINYDSKVFRNPFLNLNREILGGLFLSKSIHLSFFTFEKVTGVQVVFVPDKKKNDARLYNDFLNHKDLIEKTFGMPLIWDKDKNNVYSISFKLNGSIHSMDQWDNLQDQLVLKMMALEKAFIKVFDKLYKKN